MKILFLDIDGVLNCDSCKEMIDDCLFVMDSKLDLLKQIIEQTDAKVVLTSTWRFGWEDDLNDIDTKDRRHFLALRDKFLEYGIEFMDYIPILSRDMSRRGEEIHLWLEGWKGESIEKYCILDDLDGRYLRPHSRYLVRTSFVHGLQEKHVRKTIEMLL